VIVVTPEGEESEWMQKEQFYAADRRLPLIPLLRRGDLWFRLINLQGVDARRSTVENPAPEGLFAALLAVAPRELSDDLKRRITNDDQGRRRLIPELAEAAEKVNSPHGFAARDLLRKWAAEPPDSDARMARAALERM
jgi:hypothetical protein